MLLVAAAAAAAAVDVCCSCCAFFASADAAVAVVVVDGWILSQLLLHQQFLMWGGGLRCHTWLADICQSQFAPSWMAGRPPSRDSLHQLRVVINKVVVAVFCCSCCCCHHQTKGQGKGIIGSEIRSSGSNFHLEMRGLRNQHVSLFMCGSFFCPRQHIGSTSRLPTYMHAHMHTHKH